MVISPAKRPGSVLLPEARMHGTSNSSVKYRCHKGATVKVPDGRRHLDTRRSACDDAGETWQNRPPIVRERFLLPHRVNEKEFLLAFSCKTRELCPSCAAKPSAATVALLAEEVLEEVAHAQRVFVISKMLRPYFLHHRPLLGDGCRR